MTHALGFVLRPHVESRNPSNLRVQLVAHLVAWLAMASAAAHLPLPLVGNAGVLLAFGACAAFATVDVLTALLVGAITVGWAYLPGGPWRQPLALGVGASLGMIAAAAIVAHFARVYHHERASFLGGGSRRSASALVFLFGVFPLSLRALLLAGWRPRLASTLAEQAGNVLRLRERVPWHNWAKLASCHAQVVSVPATIDDLVAAVRDVRARGLSLRVVASGFSWTALCTSDDALLFCERLDRVEVDLSDPERPCVWAEAGVTNRQLNAELAKHGLCMPWNVVLETVRVAGIVSSGTHGTGKTTATVGDLVEVLEVIDGTGALRTLSVETVGEETMRAARLGLGLFGVIARVKLRVARTYRVRQTDRRVPIGPMLADLPALVAAHDSVELYWFPFNRDAWMRTIDRTDDPHTPASNGFWFRAQNLYQSACGVLFFGYVARAFPSLTPPLLKLGMRLLSFRSRVLDLPESHHYRHWIEMMPAGCMEVGFKVDADFANVREAWRATERVVDEQARRGRYPLNLTLNVRFTGASEALLTPACGEGLTCFVEIMWMGRPPGWAELSSQLCRAWLSVPGALPHWSKEFEHVDGVVPIIREHLGDRRRRFLDALASTGIDPAQRFANPMLRRMLLDDLPERRAE